MRVAARIAAFAALALVAVPAGAEAEKVAVGDYESAPAIAPGKSYSVGVFSVIRTTRGRRIVRNDQYAGIFYPDARDCDDLDVPLRAKSIPISSKGRFRARDRTRVADSAVRVNWRGHWSRPGVVSGSITIRYAGCTSKHRWTGGKVG